MENENGVIIEESDSAATGETTEIASPSTTSSEETDQVNAVESKDSQEENSLPQNFRDGYKSLERDVKEKYKPVVDKVEALGGMAVLDALKPLTDIFLNEQADPATVVQTLQQTLLPQHLEAVAWAAIDSPETQQVLLADPDIRNVISNTFFAGKSIESVQAFLELMEDEEIDPNTRALQQKVTDFERAQQENQTRQQSLEANQRVQDLQKRFFVDTAEEVVGKFNLNAPEGATEADKQLFADTIEDLRFAAQGRFLKDNSEPYMQIQEMYAKGYVTQARVAEARLQNKWQATLIKTAERHSNQLKSVIGSQKAEQVQKAQNIRPDVTGNVPMTQQTNSERYDLNDPNWLTNFLSEFKREAALRG